MSDDAHYITEAQLSAEARDLRAAAAAQKALAGKQDRVAVVVTVVVPVTLVIIKTAWEPMTPVAVFYALGVLLAYVLGLERIRAGRLRAAARSREQHDCVEHEQPACKAGPPRLLPSEHGVEVHRRVITGGLGLTPKRDRLMAMTVTMAATATSRDRRAQR